LRIAGTSRISSGMRARCFDRSSDQPLIDLAKNLGRPEGLAAAQPERNNVSDFQLLGSHVLLNRIFAGWRERRARACNRFTFPATRPHLVRNQKSTMSKPTSKRPSANTDQSPRARPRNRRTLVYARRLLSLVSG
jgi:hypothetical protein